jgi:prophage regulatory protein
MNYLSKMGVIRLPAVLSLVGLSRSTVYSLIKNNAFPKPVKLSARSVGWKLSDIESWLESRAITVQLEA